MVQKKIEAQILIRQNLYLKNSNLNLNFLTNPLKLKIQNNKDQIIYKRNKNSYTNKNTNIRNNKYNFKTIKIIKNNDINKLLINDFKTNSYSLKDHFSIFKNKKKNRKKTLYENDDIIGNNYRETEYLAEENMTVDKEEFDKYTAGNKTLIRYIKKNNYDFYENEFNKENLTKAEISLLIKKYNLLLEEKYLYKKKIIMLQKENKKLKEEKIYNYKDNNQLREGNEMLKKEIISLKSKINELIDGDNKKFKERDETYLNDLNSYV